jgi:hypothetical protein
VTKDLFRLAGRVTVAKKLRKIIKENRLTRIKVPKKYLCSFPEKLVSRFSIPFHHRHVYILCEKCDVEPDQQIVAQKTVEELKKMNSTDMEELASQIQIFMSQSVVLDFLWFNIYVKEGKMVLFDTEPMSLMWPSFLCISPSLKAARINLNNMARTFAELPEASPIVNKAISSIRKIREQERKKMTRVVCIALLVLGIFVLLRRLDIIPKRINIVI